VDLLVVSINAVVVAVVGLIVVWFGRGRFEAIDRRFDRLQTRLDGRIDSLEARLDGRIDGRIDGMETRFERLEMRMDARFETLQSSLEAMRSDLTQVALAVGVRPRAQND
jgi:hypothetical protein